MHRRGELVDIVAEVPAKAGRPEAQDVPSGAPAPLVPHSGTFSPFMRFEGAPYAWHSLTGPLLRGGWSWSLWQLLGAQEGRQQPLPGCPPPRGSRWRAKPVLRSLPPRRCEAPGAPFTGRARQILPGSNSEQGSGGGGLPPAGEPGLMKAATFSVLLAVRYPCFLPLLDRALHSAHHEPVTCPSALHSHAPLPSYQTPPPAGLGKQKIFLGRLGGLVG